MEESPYAKFDGKALILRDELAIDRTLLANERTLMAYLRSAMSLIIAGVSIVHFAEADWFKWVGLATLPLGLMVGVFGVMRFKMMNKGIQLVRRCAARSSGPATVGD